MITKHHTGKFLLPDPAPYQKKHSVLMYAAKHYGFEDGDNMVANLLHILYKLIKLQVLYQYIFEVLQMLPTPSIEVSLCCGSHTPVQHCTPLYGGMLLLQEVDYCSGLDVQYMTYQLLRVSGLIGYWCYKLQPGLLRC